MKIDRRTVLIGGGVGVGLIVGFAVWPGGMRSDLATGRQEQAFGNFIKVARSGQVTVAVPQVENGQGVWTGLAQIVADELGAAWDSVAVEPAPLTGKYDNPLVGDGRLRITANSTSIRAFEQPLRQAAATARAMLSGAAADRWNVDAADCDTADGMVLYKGRSFTFGELADEAADRSPPRNPSLRKGTEGRLIGKPLPRLDGPAKTSGIWRFAADVRLPDMLFASVRMAPPGGRLLSFDRAALTRLAGVRHVTAREDWIAVVAETWWAAEQAIKAADARFNAPATPPDMRDVFEQAIAGAQAEKLFSRGAYDSAVKGSRPLAATYYVAPSLHLGIEPVTATARINDGKVEVWAASQAAGLLSGKDGSVYPLGSGEPAGRAMEPDAAPIAIDLASQLKRPVQVTLSQSSSQNHDRAAPGALARMTALPGGGGITAAWRMRVAGEDGLSASLARLKRDGAATRMRSGGEPPYVIPHVDIEAVPMNLPFTAGYMRGSPEREFAFFTESFVDELARAAGMEPLAFRMSMLGGNGRLARSLQGAARLAQWDGGGPGSSMGIAGCSAYGSHIALVASATVGSDQRVSVQKLFAAVDCGRVINTGLVQQQIEAGLIWALGQANAAAPEWLDGMPRARPFSHIALPRLADAPRIVVEVIPSSETPGGVAGLGTTVLAPAVANAIFAGTGKRMRSLPFDPMAS